MRLDVTSRNVEVFLFRNSQGAGYVQSDPIDHIGPLGLAWESAGTLWLSIFIAPAASVSVTDTIGGVGVWVAPTTMFQIPQPKPIAEKDTPPKGISISRERAQQRFIEDCVAQAEAAIAQEVQRVWTKLNEAMGKKIMWSGVWGAGGGLVIGGPTGAGVGLMGGVISGVYKNVFQNLLEFTYA